MYYINHDPVMTLTYFKARSTWVAYVLLKCHLKGKTCRQMDRILIILKTKKWPRASSAPILGYFDVSIFIIFKLVYWYIQQISGERLQDHWSSGSYLCSKT